MLDACLACAQSYLEEAFSSAKIWWLVLKRLFNSCSTESVPRGTLAGFVLCSYLLIQHDAQRVVLTRQSVLAGVLAS